MIDDWYAILSFVIYLPLYAVTFLGAALVLRLRRTHPRACWLAIGAAVVLALNWGATAAMNLLARQIQDWAGANGIGPGYVWLAFSAVLSVLQTLAAGLMIAAIVVDRRREP